jgi:hypothetical protein
VYICLLIFANLNEYCKDYEIDMCGQIPDGGGGKEEGPPLVATAAVQRPERRRGRTTT